MKKTVVILSAVFASVLQTLALSVSEPFSYNTGAFADGTAANGTGETGNWTIPGANVTIVSGLTYSNLPVSGNAFRQVNNGSGRSLVNFSSAYSAGTKYFAFLIQGSGDSGGNWAGAYLKGSNSTSLFLGFRGGFSATQTSFGLGSVGSTNSAPTGGTALGATVNIGNTNVHFIVAQIDFNTSGANDTVRLWIDPKAGTNSPGANANVTLTTYDVGAISGFGLNLQGGTANMTVDEVRVGDTYADVAGGSLNPTIATTLGLSVTASKLVSWTAYATNYYQPQRSTDGSSWNDWGSLLTGSTVTSLSDSTPVDFYRVLETVPTVAELCTDGGLETDGGNNTAFYWSGVGSQPPVRNLTDFHNGAASLTLSVTNVDITANTSEMQQNLIGAGGTGASAGNTYTFSFWAKSLPKNPSGGYVQQYRVAWLDSIGAVVGQVGWANFTAATNAWTKITSGPVVAPANTANALIQIFAATGGIANDYGGVLIDDISLSGTSANGAVNTLTPVVQNGAVFTANVLTNGVLASGASGTVQFKTNSVGQSQKTFTGGTANSDAAVVPASYTLLAIYSGDALYIGSTNTLTVTGGGGGGGGTVSISGGAATTVFTGTAGSQYYVQRATNPGFTTGVTNFPTVTAPAGGAMTNVDNFTDLGSAPAAAYYRLRTSP